VKIGLETIKEQGFGNCEVVLSEADPDGWAAGGMYDNRNMNFRNTEYYATYVAAGYYMLEKLAREAHMDVRPLAWAFMFVGERCFEGTRTFTTQGIDKAVFNLFKMYAKMDGRILPVSSSGDKDLLLSRNNLGEGDAPLVSGTAVLDDNNTIRIMLFSHHDDWDVEVEQELEIAIENCPIKDKINIKHYRIDKSHSNAYTEWVKQGKPNYPAGQLYADIKKRSELELYQNNEIYNTDDGKLQVRFTLPAHAISLIEISGE
jgi:xylan 1,4-beta-xylosidase